MPEKLTPDDIELITALREHREQLRREIRELTDKKLAEKFDVHPTTIRRVGRLEKLP